MKNGFFLSFFLSPVYGKNERCWNDTNFHKMERILSKPPIQLSYLDIRRANTYFFKLIFRDNIKGFYKIRKVSDSSETLSAIRFYLFSRLMDFKFVPPTSIFMCHPVQLYIDNKGGYGWDFLQENLSSIEKTDIFTFYFLFGGLDPTIHNILLGKICKNPALIDHDSSSISHIKYGDYPFMSFSYNTPKSILSIDDFKNFPFHKAIELSSFNELRDYFKNENIKRNPDNFSDNFDNLENKTLHIVKYKNYFWIKKIILITQEFGKTLFRRLFHKGHLNI